MKNYKSMVAMLLALVMILCVAACGKNETVEDGDDSEPIKIGYVNDLTGDGAGWGVPAMRGAEMAVAEINANGGLLGREVQLIVQDGRGDPQDSVTALNKLIGDECVAVVGTTTSGPNIAMAPVADGAEVPLLGLGCSNEQVTVDENGNLHPYSFRLTYIDSFSGEALAKYLYAEGYKTAGVLINQGDAYSVGVTDAFIDAYEAIGGKIVVEEDAYDTDSDFRAQLTNIKAADPEVFVFNWSYTYAALIAQQAKEMGLEMQYAGTDGWDVYNLAEMANGALEGAFYCARATFLSDESLEFKQKYFDAYPEETECGSESLLGCEAINWLAKAITEKNSADPKDIRDYLENTTYYESELLGDFSVNEFHNLEIELVAYEIKDGERIVRDYISIGE